MAESRRASEVVIVFDSGSQGDPAVVGRTAVLAGEIARGAKSVDNVGATLVPVADRARHWDAMHTAAAIVFGCPTYMGSASAAFKEFMEDSFHRAWREQRWRNKIAATFTNSVGRSGDKLATIMQLNVFAAQHGMLLVSLGEMPGHISSLGTEDDINRLASFSGLMAQSNADEGPATTPPPSDRRTAVRFGRRIGLVARSWALAPHIDTRGREGTVPRSGGNHQGHVRGASAE